VALQGQHGAAVNPGHAYPVSDDSGNAVAGLGVAPGVALGFRIHGYSQSAALRSLPLRFGRFIFTHSQHFQQRPTIFGS
jgi:hypothetical protein